MKDQYGVTLSRVSACWLGALLVVVSLWPVSLIRAADTSTVRIAPASLELPVGGTGVTTVEVEAMSDLYGFEIQMAFDPAVVEVVDADPDKAGVQVALGTVFEGKRYFVAHNSVDQTAGTIYLVATLRTPSEPIEGSGSVASITWRLKQSSTSPVELAATSLSTSSAAPIDHRVEHGEITFKDQGDTPSPVAIQLSPQTTEVLALETGKTTVQVFDVSSLSMVDLRLTFDPNLVEVVDADPTQDGVQIALGPWASAGGSAVSLNVVDNTRGEIAFTVAFASPDSWASVEEAFVVITWRGKQAGEASLGWQSLKLLDGNGNVIPHQFESGEVKVMPNDTSGSDDNDNTISGVVHLQGREDHAKTRVFLTEDPCPNTYMVTGETLFEYQTTLTDKDGRFELALNPDDAYRCLLAVQDGFLFAQIEDPEPQVLGTIVLPSGDVNQDNVINILDLAFVASCLPTDDSAADLNADGDVNVLDLTLASGNFGKQGPVVWD